MNARAVPEVHWTDIEGDDRPRWKLDAEEKLDERRRHKALADCTLPEGFRLVTKRPRQVVTDGLLIYSFILAYKRVMVGADIHYWETFYFVQRYEVGVQDDIQMEWAMTDFRRELAAEGIEFEDCKALGRSSRRQELPLRGDNKLAGAPVGPVALGRCRGASGIPAKSTRPRMNAARAA